MSLTDTLLHWSPARADAHQVLTALALDCWFDGNPDEAAFVRHPDDVAPPADPDTLGQRTRAALERLLAAESLRDASADLRHVQAHHDSFFRTPWPVFWLGIDHASGRRRLPPGLVQQLRDTLASRRHENPAITRQRAHTILVLTVSGPQRPRPDVYVAGPALRGQEPDSEQRSVVKVFDFSRIEHASENSLRGMIDQLHKLGSHEGCASLFDASQAGDVRSVVRRALKDRLAELMTLLEASLPAHTPGTTTPASLRALRESASVLVFRLMFLGELERRGLLYGTSAGSGEDAGAAQESGGGGRDMGGSRERAGHGPAPTADGRDAGGSRGVAPHLHDAQAAALDDDPRAEVAADEDLLARFRHLTAVLAGRTADPTVAVRGGSLFASAPHERFERAVVAWLEAFDDAHAFAPDPALRRRWNRCLALTLQAVQGVVDQREATGHLREADREIGYLGLGAVAHTHRVLGDVYEQVLALTPQRTQSGAITLTLGGREATTESNERKALGAHYTAESLVEEIVRPALGGRFTRLWEEVGEDPAKYVKRLERLRLVDPAMGSAHFLTVGARELATEIVWVQRYGAPRHVAHPRVHTHPVEGPPTPGLEGEEESSFHAALTRVLPAVVQRSCFGVDVSPIATELGKLSLWLFTMAAQERACEGEVTERPDLAFLDGNIRCGDALLGVWWAGAREALAERLGVSVSRMGGPAGKTLDLFGGWAEQGGETAQERHDQVMALQAHLREDAASLRAWARTIDGRAVLGRDAEELDVYGLRQRLHARTRELIGPIRYVFDLALLAAFLDVRPRRAAGEKALRRLLAGAMEGGDGAEVGSWQRVVDGSLGAPSADVAAVREAIAEVASTAPLVNGRPLRAFHWGYEFPSVFDGAGGEAGFDVILANPPFLGGQKLTGAYGKPYREFLVEALAAGQRGSADLSAYFVLRYAELLREGGVAGTLATNTIAQGDTREVGLDQAVARGLRVFRAVPSRKWPGSAVLEVAHVWLVRGEWSGPFLREDTQATAAQEGGGPPVWEELPGLTSYLTAPGEVTGPPRRLPENAGKCFQGSNVLGMGFVLTPEEAQELIAKDARNAGVLFPYLNGRDLNTSPTQEASRWIINFLDWPLDRSAEGSWVKGTEMQRNAWLRSGRVPSDYSDPVAEDYPECLEIVERLVKPERAVNKYSKTARQYWWRYERARQELYEELGRISAAIYAPRVSKYASFVRLAPDMVSSEQTVVITDPRYAMFAMLQSTVHDLWTAKYQSSLETRRRYTPSDCFETFPFPPGTKLAGLEDVGERYHAHRAELMERRQEGLTKLYNRFHNPEETSSDIEELRALHVEMDTAVLAAYTWGDLAPGHDFHATPQGVRYTFSEEAREEVLARLLRGNLGE